MADPTIVERAAAYLREKGWWLSEDLVGTWAVFTPDAPLGFGKIKADDELIELAKGEGFDPKEGVEG